MLRVRQEHGVSAYSAVPLVSHSAAGADDASILGQKGGRARISRQIRGASESLTVLALLCPDVSVLCCMCPLFA